jgi:mRNA-degrading endonuclease RelE of RelBE toxin-antitoxin system
MARFMSPTRQDLAAVYQKFRDRPQHVRDLLNRLDLFELYKLRTTGYRVVICAIEDDASVTVSVPRQYNETMYDGMLFGVDPDDLEPCELPGEHEIVVKRTWH